MVRRITLVIHSLQGGGAERVAAAMVNHWAQTDKEVTLLTLGSTNDDAYAIDENVRRVSLSVLKQSTGLFDGLFNNIGRIRRLRRAVRDSKPDVVISLVDRTNILTLLACKGLGLKVIVCERTDPRHHNIGRSWSILRRISYRKCQSLVVQTTGVAEYARQSICKTRPVYVLPNPVLSEPSNETEQPPGTTDNHRYVVALGRLVPAKGFDRAIGAFGLIADKHPNWSLRILGEGPLRPNLQEQINELNLADRVSLPGWVDDPIAHLGASHLYLLSSHFEGFPNALLEAMACGLPVVSFNCESGPAEIVRDGVNGVLVPQDDVKALAAAMDRVISDEELRKKFAHNATEVKSRFSREMFFRRWDAILNGMPVPDYEGL